MTTISFIEQFKTKAAKKALDATDMYLLCLVKAHHSKSENKVEVAEALLKRAFTPISKPSKLNGHNDPYRALRAAHSWVRYCLNNHRYTFFTDEEHVELLAFAKAVLI